MSHVLLVCIVQSSILQIKSDPAFATPTANLTAHLFSVIVVCLSCLVCLT